ALFDATGAGWLADLDAAKANDWLNTLRADRRPARLPEGQEWFRNGEAARLLGVDPTVISKAVRRRRLQAVGHFKKRRLPRATVGALADGFARGVSPQTINHHVRSLRAFGRWLVLSERLPSNPFGTLALVSTATDRRHDRRELDA